MYSEKELEEREYQLDLASLNTKRNGDLAVALAMISAGVALIAIYFPMKNSPEKYLLIIFSLILIGMSVVKVDSSRNENKEEKKRIIEKYIKKYRVEIKKEPENQNTIGENTKVCNDINSLKLEYDFFLKDIQQRGSEHITFNSILISGSILVLISILNGNITMEILGYNVTLIIPLTILIMLVFSWKNIHLTRDLDNLFWDRIKDIEPLIGIEYGHRGIKEDIDKIPWYWMRTNLWDCIYLLLFLLAFSTIIAVCWP